LNMIDVAESNGHQIDAGQLAAALGVPVLPVVASTGQGLPDLRHKIIDFASGGTKRVIPRTFCELPVPYGREIESIAGQLEELFHQRHTSSEAEALLLITDDRALNSHGESFPPGFARR